MGLSHEERAAKISYSLKRMNEFSKVLAESKGVYLDDFKKLSKLVNKSWHAYLGQQKNSGHWIMGSSSDCQISPTDCSPWALSVREHVNSVLEKNFETEDRTFNSFKDFLSIGGLLSHCSRNGKELSATFSIYKETEFLIYSLRRYDDDFRKQFASLDKLISDIQGVCFSIFSENSDYAKAYLISEISKIVYGGEYYAMNESKDQDFTTQWLVQSNAHHDLSTYMNRDMDGKELMKMLIKAHHDLTVKWEKIKPAEQNGALLTERILAALKLCGPRFHYEHSAKELLNTMKASKRFSPKQIAAVQKTCAECQTLHKKESDSRQENYEKHERIGGTDFYSYNFEKSQKISSFVSLWTFFHRKRGIKYPFFVIEGDFLTA